MALCAQGKLDLQSSAMVFFAGNDTPLLELYLQLGQKTVLVPLAGEVKRTLPLHGSAQYIHSPCVHKVYSSINSKSGGNDVMCS